MNLYKPKPGGNTTQKNPKPQTEEKKDYKYVYERVH
jgi:hypothetical protein